MTRKNDLFYINEIKSGNSDSYRFLINRYKDLIFTIALRIVQNREDAEEIAQDTFIKAYRSIHTFKGKAEFSTWLYKIAYNLSVSFLRKKKYKHIEINEQFISDNDIFETYNDFIKSDEKEKNEILKKAVNSLNEKDALIISLFYINELSVREIEKITDLSRSNIKIRLFRARQQLFALLSDKKELIFSN